MTGEVQPSPSDATTDERISVSVHAAVLPDGRRDVWLEVHPPAGRITPEDARALAALVADMAAVADTARNTESQLSGQAAAGTAMPRQWSHGNDDPPGRVGSSGQSGPRAPHTSSC